MQTLPATLDIPQTYTLDRKAPEDLDQATLELVRRMDQEVEAGRHPASITLIWKDATLKLEARSWLLYKQGQLDLAGLGGRLSVQSGSEPLKPRGETAEGLRSLPLPGGWKAGLAGCGCLGFLILVVGIVLLMVRRSRKNRNKRVSAPARPAPQKPASPPPIPQVPAAVPPPPPIPSPMPPPVPSPQPPPIPAASLALVFLTGSRAGQSVELGLQPGFSLRVGRDADNDLVLEDGSVSRHHAILQAQEGRLVLSDLASSNGTFHQDHRLQGPVVLSAGDLVRFGQIQARIR